MGPDGVHLDRDGAAVSAEIVIRCDGADDDGADDCTAEFWSGVLTEEIARVNAARIQGWTVIEQRKFSGVARYDLCPACKQKRERTS